jgi:hypothetical protein
VTIVKRCTVKEKSQDFLSTKIFIYITLFTVTTEQGKYELTENITKKQNDYLVDS